MMEDERRVAVQQLEMAMEIDERTEDDKGKAMWRSLARQEALHLQYLTNARRTLVEKGRWASFGMEGARFLSEQEIRRIFPETAEGKVEPDADELAALETGIEMEIRWARISTRNLLSGRKPTVSSFRRGMTI